MKFLDKIKSFFKKTEDNTITNCNGGCHACKDLALKEAEKTDPHAWLRFQRFIICPICGNKRCPKATNHTLKCTGSNELGQPGSIY